MTPDKSLFNSNHSYDFLLTSGPLQGRQARVLGQQGLLALADLFFESLLVMVVVVPRGGEAVLHLGQGLVVSRKAAPLLLGDKLSI